MAGKFYLGCVIPARLPFLEASARLAFEKLGVDVGDVEGATCCPDPTGMELVDHDTWLVLGARNLSLYESNGGEVVSMCNGCTETLKWVQHELAHDPAKMEKVNAILEKVGKKYRGVAVIKHFAQVLHENLELLRERVVRPLEGLKAAVHYGCHYLRPSAVIQWDDPNDPHTLDDIVVALGAETIPYGLKQECCGNPVGKTDDELSHAILKDKLDSVADTEANCVVVVCPACYQQFDFGQGTVNKGHGTEFKYPVFYLSELVAIALGVDPGELGLKFHRNKVTELLESLGLMESPSE
ncbi:MAG: CoB--CoM heterodisulfide reductase subunit B [Promethearchaeota archaeon]